MRDNLIVNQESERTTPASNSGWGCLSSVMVGIVFGVIVGVATLAAGYPISTALTAGGITALGMVILWVISWMLSVLAFFGFFAAIAALIIFLAPKYVK